MTSNSKSDFRKLAEEKVNAEDVQSTSMYPSEIQELLYELRVHQIQLEMQNEELHRTQVELETSREHYFDLFDLAPIGYIVIDKDGIIINANLSAANLFGIQRQKLLNKPLSGFINPADQDIYYHLWKKLFETGIPDACELNLLDESRISFWARLEVTMYRNKETGEPICRMVISDLSQKKEAEEKIIRFNEQILKLIAEKDKFFSIIAHDLRNPFNTFLGFTEVLSEDLKNMSREDIQNIADSMKKTAKNLFQLLENLLEWAKMKQGLTEFKPEITPLIHLVNSCVETLSETATQKDIEMIIRVPGDLHVKVDTKMIRSAIRNIISNAVKFTPRGGKIFLSAKVLHSRFIEIAISDTGVGMSPELLGRLFQIAEETGRQGTEDEPSTGLGLHLCKEFIEKHNGTIWAESEEGKGSTFYFTLPMNNE